jgi:DNA-3-methyladenine glycosylase
MPDSTCLPVHFYRHDVVQVARDLLGMKLVRVTGKSRQEGIILETEAYRGEEDLACHAHVGLTRRNAVMYGPPGRAYVYFTYGIHWMLNCVCQDEGSPAAVLIRAVLPILGLEEVAARRRGRPRPEWANGPAKLCQAFQIDGSLNGIDLTTPSSGLFIEESIHPPLELIHTSPRVGIKYAPEPWLSMPWRFHFDADLL